MVEGMSRTIVVVLVAGLLGSCGDGSTPSNIDRPAASTVPATSTEASTLPPEVADTVSSTVATTATSDEVGPNLTVGVDEPFAEFIAAMENSLAGTRYEGEPLASAEVFLATGWLMCEELNLGADPDDLLTHYVEELTGGTIDAAGDDELILAGSLLGVSVGVLCPDHEPVLGY